MRRAAVALAVLVASAAPVAVRAEPVTYSDVPIEMSDGAVLEADVFLPDATGTFPAILQMTPYNRDLLGDDYVEEGYVKVNVDVRGTGRSEGAMCIFCDREQQDVYDVVQWIAGREWSDGGVGMTGGSYEGITTLLGAAKQPPALKAIVPVVAYADPYRDIAYHNGMYTPFFMFQWLALQTALSSSGGLPAGTAGAERAYQTVAPIDVLKEPFDGALYQERAIYNKYDRITVPTLILDGWFDGFARGAIWNFQGIAAEHKRLIMNPFGHKGGPGRTCLGPGGCYARPNPWFPTTAYADAPPPPGAGDPSLAWFDHFLKGVDNGIEDEPPMLYYDLGAREWRSADVWPPDGAGLLELSLSGERSGTATSLNDGSLSPVPPEGDATRPDRYVYDPSQGAGDTFARWGELAATPQVPTDQRTAEARALTYTSAALADPLRLAGPIELRFFAQTDAPDTDFVVKVSDVAPDGSSTLFTQGFMRATHREYDRFRSRPAEPWISNLRPAAVRNEPMEIRIDIWHTAYELQPLHRLRIAIAPSDVPNHDPLPYASRNTIFHDAQYPATLTLTVT